MDFQHRNSECQGKNGNIPLSNHLSYKKKRQTGVALTQWRFNLWGLFLKTVVQLADFHAISWYIAVFHVIMCHMFFNNFVMYSLLMVTRVYVYLDFFVKYCAMGHKSYITPSYLKLTIYQKVIRKHICISHYDFNFQRVPSTPICRLKESENCKR